MMASSFAPISTNLLYGIWFNDASGTVDNVTVDHIFQFQNGALRFLPDRTCYPRRG